MLKLQLRGTWLVSDFVDGFIALAWLIILLVVLTLLQRRLHFETQALLLLVTRRVDVALALFSLLLLPGVLLHEIGHFITARLLGVQTGKFSLLPQALPDGRLRLGFVETANVDVLRDAIIGSAPLLTGSGFVIYASLVPLGLMTLWDGFARSDWIALVEMLMKLPDRPDFWLWFYLTFAVSSTMLPSASDRRSWLPIAIMAGIIIGLASLAGAGPWLISRLAPTINQILHSLTLVFGISACIHLILLIPFWAFRNLLMRVISTKVV